MDVYGGDWGLGCNSIHFIDLLSFLSEKSDFKIDSLNLKPIENSKRKQFVEYSGTIFGGAGDISFSLTAERGSKARHIITLRGEKNTVVLDETIGALWKVDNTAAVSKQFHVPYQSEITCDIAADILINGKCGLTKYNESKIMHLSFIRAIALSGITPNKEICQIT